MCYSNRQNREAIAQASGIPLLAYFVLSYPLLTDSSEHGAESLKLNKFQIEVSFRSAAILCALATSPELQSEIVETGVVPQISKLLRNSKGVHSGPLRALIAADAKRH